jgi:hypothetical protein
VNLNPRLHNWKQVLGAVMLLEALGWAIAFAVHPEGKFLWVPPFALWMGWRLWSIGAAEARAPR